jgi:hypothetical protein
MQKARRLACQSDIGSSKAEIGKADRDLLNVALVGWELCIAQRSYSAISRARALTSGWAASRCEDEPQKNECDESSCSVGS